MHEQSLLLWEERGTPGSCLARDWAAIREEENTSTRENGRRGSYEGESCKGVVGEAREEIDKKIVTEQGDNLPCKLFHNWSRIIQSVAEGRGGTREAKVPFPIGWGWDGS
ncbi:hypothetical protein R1sor_027259 [Riccia sorocarpa]|uniref:Uncharacterized protein n=1 Tax=Riccia sorocarpa TaxID=122646 RepID=A0ABD3GFD3_9MARC